MKDKKLCDICHDRPAIHHTIYGVTGTMRALCEICFGDSASAEELALQQNLDERLRGGRCDYCGVPAAEASICCEIPGVMEEEAHFLCRKCRQDLNEFNRRPENALPEYSEDEEVSDEELRSLAEHKRRQDEFMRQRIEERGKNATG
jgi:hypothetical protein